MRLSFARSRRAALLEGSGIWPYISRLDAMLCLDDSIARCYFITEVGLLTSSEEVNM